MEAIPLKIFADEKRHMVCVPYSITNLHAMAQLFRIKRCWFYRTHYDIPKLRVKEILPLVARVSSREILNIIQTEAQTYTTSIRIR